MAKAFFGIAVPSGNDNAPKKSTVLTHTAMFGPASAPEVEEWARQKLTSHNVTSVLMLQHDSTMIRSNPPVVRVPAEDVTPLNDF